MNTTPEVQGSNGQSGSDYEPQGSELETVSASPPPTQQQHRKISKLPKPLRDLINSMLDDSLPARQIIAKLQQSTDPPLPYPISEMNISRWKDTGYQRYLAQQERLTTIQANREAALEMVAADDTTTLPEATLQIIASQYYEFLADFSPESLKEKLAEDPLKYTRFLNVFARLVREILQLRKYRDASALAAAQLQQLDPDRELSDREHELWANRMDSFFKRARRKTPPDSSSLVTQKPREGGLVAPKPSEGGLVAPKRSEDGPDLPGASDESAPAPQQNTRETIAIDASSIGNQNSKIQNPNSHQPEACYSCGVPLPALLTNGQRPFKVCPGCGIRLYPPGTTFDHCPICDAHQPILSNGERLSPECQRCGQVLPPPGQRFVTHCPACRLKLPNVTSLGTHSTDRCPDFHTLLPLLEPAF